MLTSSEIAQSAKDAAGPKATVENRTRQTEVPFEVTVSLARSAADRARGVTKRGTTTIDEPEITVSYGRKAAVTFTVERLDPAGPRWLVTTASGTVSVVHGAGDVERAVTAARTAAGVLDHRSPHPSKLGGTDRAMDTTGTTR